MSALSSIAALGSSYAAGPGIPPIEDVAAMRSGANYAHLLAQRLGARLTDLTVSGATTETILDAPQTAWNGLRIPPQIGGLPADAELVTLTAGGNDLGFIGAAMAAAARAAGPGSEVAALLAVMGGGSAGGAPDGAGSRTGSGADTGAGARADVGPDAGSGSDSDSGLRTAPDLPPVPVPTADDVERAAAGLARVVDAVRDRAPRARVLLVDYLALLGPATTPEAAALGADDLDALRTVQTALEEAFTRAAERTDAELVAVSALSREHALGSAEPWVTGLVPTRRGLAGSYHPNAVGMRAVAHALATLLG